MQKKLEQLQQLEESLVIAKDKAYEKLELIQSSINEKLLEIFDFEKKFIKIKSWLDSSLYTYMWCDCVSRIHNLSGDREIMFRGYGFSSEITQYRDATWFIWDELKDVSFKEGLNMSYCDILKHITVITEDEFNTVFDEYIKNVVKRHKSNMNDIKQGKGI